MAKEPAKESLSDKLKQKAKSLASKLIPSKSTIIDTTAYLLGLAALLVLIAKAPEMHNSYIRSVVGSRVYKIQATTNGGGGTGFQVHAPSGTDYVVTNSHVCDHILKTDTPEHAGTVILVNDDSEVIRRRVVAVSDASDLCLIEGAPGVSGLSLGNEPAVGDAVQVVGHPFLRPITLSAGEIVGVEDVKIVSYIMNTTNPMLEMQLEGQLRPDAKCDMPKNEVYTIQLPNEIGGGEVNLCLDVTSNAYMTTAIIFPGNSGSPMVDYRGRVIGVAFATSERGDNWGSVVSLSDLKDFLAHY